MQALIEKLIRVYQRERELYREILHRVRCQRALIDDGRSYPEINEELKAKRDLLLDIDSLEASIREERQIWQSRQRGFDGEQARQLMALLTEVTELVEQILNMERENEVLLSSRRVRGVKPVVRQTDAVASYRANKLMEVKS